MKRLLWQLRRPAIRTPQLGSVLGYQLPQHGASVLTATYVLKDTLYSIQLYTLATALLQWISILPGNVA